MVDSEYSLVSKIDYLYFCPSTIFMTISWAKWWLLIQKHINRDSKKTHCSLDLIHTRSQKTLLWISVSTDPTKSNIRGHLCIYLMCNPCLYTAVPHIWAQHTRMDCGCADLATFNKVLTDMSLFSHLFQVDNQLLGTTHPVMLCVTPSSIESSAVDSGPALQVNSVKVPSSLMLTDLYKVKPTYGLTSSPKKCFRPICTSFVYRSLIIDFTLCLTASDGHSLPLYCHHWGEAPNETAHILWLRSDRGRYVVGIPLMCSIGNAPYDSLLRTVHDFVFQRWRSWMRTFMRKPMKMQELQSAIILRTWRSVFLRSSWVSSPLTSYPLTWRYKSHSRISWSTVSSSLDAVLLYEVYEVVCSIIKCCSAQALKGTLGLPLIRFEDAIINMYPYTRVHPYETQEMIINDILKHFKEVLNILHSELLYLH